MNVFDQFLSEREEAEEPRPSDWGDQGKTAEARLIKFDRWVRKALADRLQWGGSPAENAKRVEQCRDYLERMVIELWRRGWMLDGQALAARILEVLDRVGAYQKKGVVADFWPYFRACVDRYVGANAEEIQAEAMRAGSQVSQLLNALTAGSRASGSRLPELIAQRAKEQAEAAQEKTLREKLADERRKAKDRDQLPLL